MDKRGRGRGGREYHKLLSKFCCLTVPKNFVGEPFCAVFQKLSGSEKKLCGGGEYQDFPSKIFCLTVPKKFVVEPFSVLLISGTENFMLQRVISRSPSKIFCLTVPKKFVVEPFSVSLISGTEKIYASQGYLTIFRRKFFCLTVPKHFVDEPFYAVFQRTSGSEKVYG